MDRDQFIKKIVARISVNKFSSATKAAAGHILRACELVPNKHSNMMSDQMEQVV